MTHNNDGLSETAQGVKIGEIVLAVIAGMVGIYSLGQGLSPFFHADAGMYNVLWLLVTAAAMLILSAQMSRVHDSWPHKPFASKRHS